MKPHIMIDYVSCIGLGTVQKDTIFDSNKNITSYYIKAEDRVKANELHKDYTKLIYLHLPTDCFTKISLQSTGRIVLVEVHMGINWFEFECCVI